MAQDESKGRFRRLLRGLSRTRDSLATRLRDLTGTRTRLDEEQLEEIEEILLGADCGVEVTMAVVDALRSGKLFQDLHFAVLQQCCNRLEVRLQCGVLVLRS